MIEQSLDFRTGASLKTFTLFDVLGKEDRIKLGGMMQFRDYEENQILYTEGSAGTELHVLLAGEVESSVDGKATGSLKAKCILGEVALLSNTPHMHTVKATKNCRTLFITRDKFRMFCAVAPSEFISRIVELARQRVRESTEEDTRSTLSIPDDPLPNLFHDATGSHSSPGRGAGETKAEDDDAEEMAEKFLAADLMAEVEKLRKENEYLKNSAIPAALIADISIEDRVNGTERVANATLRQPEERHSASF